MSRVIPTLPLNDKRAIPAIGFGTGTALYGKDATGYVVQAIEGGFNHIDTAQMYQNEESVGEALREVFRKGEKAPFRDEKVDLELGQPVGKIRREDIWVTTKYGSQGNAEAALDVSLKKVSGLRSL
jgi:diketogulonate reductase-like aldo/keto reductase